MKNGFSFAAEFYEELMGKEGDAWAKKTVSAVRRAAVNPRGADVGCGTGKVTRALCAAGFDAVGMDPSPEMLSEAMRLGGAQYVFGSMKDAAKLRGLGFVTAVNDVVNYIRPKDLDKNFAAVFSALAPGGAFLFDLSTEYRLRQVIGENLFGEDGEEMSYLWFNRQKKDGVLMELVYFVKRGGTYEREEESFFEYIHTEEEVISALSRAGFGKIKTARQGSPAERLFFRAVRPGR